MYKYLCAIFIFIYAQAYTPNVVLISSLETPDIWYRSNSWEVEDSLEKIFNSAFEKTDYNIVVIEKATPSDLRRELLNPDNMAVFWVSHAGLENNINSGIVNNGTVIDYYANDVVNLFKEIHPNMRFLGLIGCKAKNTINRFYSEGHYDDNENLKIHSFEKIVGARSGLKKSIKASAEKLGTLKKVQRKVGPKNSTVKERTLPEFIDSKNFIQEFSDTKSCGSKKLGHKIIVRRTLNQESTQALLLVDEKIVGYFPEAKVGEVQEIEVYVSPKYAKSPKKIKFKLDSLKYFSKV